MSQSKSWKTPEAITASGARERINRPEKHEFRMAVNGVATMTTVDEERSRALETIMRYARMCADEGEILVEEHVGGAWRAFDFEEEARRREEAAAEQPQAEDAAEDAAADAAPSAEEPPAEKPKLAINFAPPE
ncbi:hypothetical protein [Rubrimonas cliftonensis]|uniref:Uncharacterized protein n=1 Tax=Rubrimonas cliftonensis TaxID=89524 RepID=A0A1H4DNH9_9RHOB|nr:hypothetical protein [Rubrimonas cliftonensis]SEA74078.1 hypothetical protein SAMN05444370_110136 [Rubrimonas cliftonensis]